MMTFTDKNFFHRIRVDKELSCYVIHAGTVFFAHVLNIDIENMKALVELKCDLMDEEKTVISKQEVIDLYHVYDLPSSAFDDLRIDYNNKQRDLEHTQKAIAAKIDYYTEAEALPDHE